MCSDKHYVMVSESEADLRNKCISDWINTAIDNITRTQKKVSCVCDSRLDDILHGWLWR